MAYTMPLPLIVEPDFIAQRFGAAAHCTAECRTVCVSAERLVLGKAKIVMLHWDLRISIEWHADLLEQAWLEAVRPSHREMMLESDWPAF